MNARILRAQDFTRQPWKNGGGVTTELAREGADPGWLWRLSVAEVGRDGPFSDFAGCERTLMLLEGAGLELAFGDGRIERIDRPHQVAVFDGGAKVEARLLAGPVKDLNLIVDRARAHGALAVLPAYGGKHFSIGSDWALFHCLAGAVAVEIAGVEYRLHAGELLRVEDAAQAAASLTELHPGSLLADIRIERL